MTSISGLTAQDAAARLATEGPNELPHPPGRTWVRIVLDVFREPMFALLMAGGAIYLALGDPGEALILLVFATLSVSIAVAQDLRSERVLQALRTLASPRALVIRGGQQIRVPGRDIVRGDTLIVSEGDRVPADAIVREVTNLLVDESALTGESVPVTKQASRDAPPAHAAPGGDNAPLVFAGTMVVGGQGIAEVVATGARSQIGAIGVSLAGIATDKPRTEKEIRRLVRIWAIMGFTAAVGATLLYGFLRGGWLDGILAGIALGMSMLPEEFPLVLTVFMVMGAWRISRARVLTRRASSIEYLGAATVLCTDKTGTLTQNQMQVATLATLGGTLEVSPQTQSLPEEFAVVARFGALASPKESFDPMERAICALARNTSSVNESTVGPLVRSYALRPELMAMSLAWGSTSGGLLIAAKGATEAIIRLCRMDDDSGRAIRILADAMAGRGLRVLGVARCGVPAGTTLPQDHADLAFAFVGLLGLSDPLREEVPAAIEECKNAGIRVVMVTGDYPATAAAIASQAGIPVHSVLSGHDVEDMDDAALARALQDTNVCARITPLQKLRIVKAFKANGEVVAMTGDCVNDAPALKAADIGIAMGGRGTDVAREAASLVLLDDDFASIVRTIRMGRRIYDNLRKAISFIMAIHVPIAGLALIPLAFGLPLLFFPIHIAFLEMIIDPVCSVVFEAEREESDIMRRPPRPVMQRILTNGMIIWAVAQGFTALLLVLGTYLAALQLGMSDERARALTFVALVATNAGLILINRSFHRRSVYAMLTRDNRTLWTVLALINITFSAILLWPTLRSLFLFGALTASEVLIGGGVGLGALLLLNAGKRFTPLARREGAKN